MHKRTAIVSLISVLSMMTGCQHSPTWQAGEQRANALAEVELETGAMLEQEAVETEPLQLAMTRVWVLPISGVGAVSDGELDHQLGQLLSELGLWRHIERIEVIGHTDSLGSDDYNQKLSVERADKVAERLIIVGLDQTLIEHTGQGESQPLADNETEQGRAENRRVEVRVTGLGPWPEDGELALLPR